MKLSSPICGGCTFAYPIGFDTNFVKKVIYYWDVRRQKKKTFTFFKVKNDTHLVSKMTTKTRRYRPSGEMFTKKRPKNTLYGELKKKIDNGNSLCWDRKIFIGVPRGGVFFNIEDTDNTYYLKILSPVGVRKANSSQDRSDTLCERPYHSCWKFNNINKRICGLVPEANDTTYRNWLKEKSR